MTIESTPFDPAEYLETDEDVAYYLDAAMDGGDIVHFARALDDVARAKGLGNGAEIEPTLDSLVAALTRMGLRLRVDRLAA